MNLLEAEELEAIQLAITVMKSEIELLDQAERMNLGDNTIMIDKLNKAIKVLQGMICLN